MVIQQVKLQVALEQVGLQFEGRLHNGLDDSKNIGRILIRLLRDGCVPMQNERIVLAKEEQEKNCNVRGRFALKTVAPVSKEAYLRINKLELHLQKQEVISINKENLRVTSGATSTSPKQCGSHKGVVSPRNAFKTKIKAAAGMDKNKSVQQEFKTKIGAVA